MAPAIELRHVTKRFLTPAGTAYTALRDLDLAVQDGEFCAVVGPTGCGKSTTLALISALDVQTRTLMENELLQRWSATRASVVFVTHDLEEAIALADRVVVITAGPGTVKGVYRVDLPRPRNVAEIRFQPEFSRIYQEIWNDLRDEVLVSYERSKRSVS